MTSRGTTMAACTHLGWMGVLSAECVRRSLAATVQDVGQKGVSVCSVLKMGRRELTTWVVNGWSSSVSRRLAPVAWRFGPKFGPTQPSVSGCGLPLLWCLCPG
jgi:hypothetical protein